MSETTVLSPYELALLYVTAVDVRGPKLIEEIINTALGRLSTLGLATYDEKLGSEGNFAWTITPQGREVLDKKEILQ